MRDLLKYGTWVALRTILLSILLTSAQPEFVTARTCSEVFNASLNNPQRPDQVWLEEKTVEYRKLVKKNSSSYPTEWKTNGVLYKNLVLLGVGSEGAVLLGYSNQGPFSIKIFRDHAHFDAGLMEFKAYKRWLPKLLAADRMTKSMVIDYIEGIDVMTIVREGHKYGINDSERLRIKNLYEIWSDEKRKNFAPIVRPSTFRPQNVIYSFKEDKFFLIDPF